jgi:ATP-dependent RNA helicase DDX47/RRP3
VAVTFVTQYDVELFQRIEELLGKKLDTYPCEESVVMRLVERVTEAQRVATTELKAIGDKGVDAEGEGGGSASGGARKRPGPVRPFM